jgi:hypothetical protein
MAPAYPMPPMAASVPGFQTGQCPQLAGSSLWLPTRNGDRAKEKASRTGEVSEAEYVNLNLFPSTR